MSATAYLLCGLPGTGKTTFAKVLEREGVRRFSLDENVLERFGRDFAPKKLHDYQRKTKESLLSSIEESLSQGLSVVLDYGFWARSEREEYRTRLELLGAAVELHYFTAPLSVMKERLTLRNESGLVENHFISPESLDSFVAEFDPPDGEEATVHGL